MKKLLSLIALGLCLSFTAYAQDKPAAGASCEAKAVDKNGKPLAGAAKTSSINKCEKDMKASASCESKAIDKNGKPLAGAAKTSFVKKCETDAKG